MSLLKKLVLIASSRVYKNHTVAMHRNLETSGFGMKLRLFFILLLISWPLAAQERHSDPDGCFSCHGLPALEFIDEDGTRRTASILRKDYYASLHGSVPCRDCHRDIKDYPHDPKNGYVDCGQSCHIEEPSEGKAFSHRDVVDEFEKSAHGKGQYPGWTKDLHGGNRLEEVEDEQNPSCRRCHYNEPYIKPDRLPIFFQAFGHVDTQCGKCHQGEVWRDQYAGHILRRLVGKHYSKNEENKMCIDCHGDVEAMRKVEIENPEKSKETGKPYLEPAGPRFILSAESYAKFLHGRLLDVGDENGASCLDCHAPLGNSARHDVMSAREEASATHIEQLPETCGQSGCHQDYSLNPNNAGFLETDVHDIDWVDTNSLFDISFPFEVDPEKTMWLSVLTILGPITLLFLFGQVIWWFWERREVSEPLLGATHFRRKMLGMQVPEKRWWPWGGSADEDETPEAKPDELDDSLIILYGSQTGNVEELAERQFDLTERWQLPVRLVNMAEFAPRELVGLRYLFVLVSTQGEGEPPLTAQGLYHYLKGLAEKEHANPLFGHLQYAVLSLGDSSYRYFCQCGKDFDSYLSTLGATSILPRVDADVDFEEEAAEWMAQVITVYQQLSGHEGVEPPPEVKAADTGYGKQRPYLAKILTNYNLNTPESAKQTHHVEIDLGDSGLTYEAGDALGIYPRNGGVYVERFIQQLGWDPDHEMVHGEECLSLHEMLFGRLEITTVTRPVLEKYAGLTGNTELEKLLADDTGLDDYLYGRLWLDILRDFPPEALAVEEIVKIFRAIPPRLYSISSSPKMHPGQVHVTLGVVRYHSYELDREGVCSNYLARRPVDASIPIYTQANSHFRPPKDPTLPMIMVGPGTGIAPFRAFIEEREATGATGKNWLFFGDQHRKSDFLYQQELEEKLERGVLSKLSLAFSRDQDERIYVHHRMREEGDELYALLEEGGSFYICGDALRMAKDVNTALIEVVMKAGGRSREQAEEYVKILEQEGRYQRDVY